MMETSRWGHWFERRRFVLCLLLAVVALFFPKMGAQFVTWDDHVLIVDNPLLAQPFWGAFKGMFGSYIHGDYLPLTMLSLWLQVNVLHASALGIHYVSLLLHVLNIWLLWHILLLCHMKYQRAFFILMVFAIHPVQVESIAWASEQKGLLATFFLLLAVRSYIRHRPNFSLAFFVLSLLSKGIAVLMPLLLIPLLLRRERRWPQALTSLAPYLAVTLLYGIVRVLAYQQSLAPDAGQWDWGAHLAGLPAIWAMALAGYIKMIFFPLELSIIYPMARLETWHIALAVVITLIGIAGMVQSRSARLQIMLILCLMAPVMHLVPRLNFINERYLYLALPWVANLSLGALMSAFKRRLYAPVMLVLAIVLVSLTSQRMEVWQSSQALWQATLERLPSHPMVLNNLGLAHLEKKEWPKAVEYFERSVEVDAQGTYRHLGLNNLGTIYADPTTGMLNLEKAYDRFNQSIQYSRRPTEILSSKLNVALVLLQMQRALDARPMLEDIIRQASLSNDQHQAYFSQRASVLLQQMEASGN